jgi:hypothetical protein
MLFNDPVSSGHFLIAFSTGYEAFALAPAYQVLENSSLNFDIIY